MEDQHVLNSLDKVPPITIYKDRFQYLNLIFNLCLKKGQYDQANYSPTIKVAFLGKCNHYLDRMFVVEEAETMITMVKNVSAVTDSSIYKRSAYIMMREAFKFVHFDTGYIFDDLFEYAHIEHDEISKIISFYYEGSIYQNIKDISSKDVDYKSKTRVFLTSNNQEIGNNINFYIYNLSSEISYKIGYYIPDNSIKYFHCMTHIPDKFGGFQDQMSAYNSLLTDPQNFLLLINNVLTDTKPQLSNLDEGDKKSKGKKKAPKNKFIGVSLVTKLSEWPTLQMKRITIGWFICEVLYQFFFYK